VVFREPQWAVTPGQSLVLYRDSLVVGGGIIEKVT
jgi:tRNA-specific 2-thiouridylase